MHDNIIFYPSNLDLTEFDEIFEKFKKQAIVRLTSAYECHKCNFGKKNNTEKITPTKNCNEKMSLVNDDDDNLITDDINDDDLSTFVIINNEEPNKKSSRILAFVIIDNLGAIIKTTASYFIAYDNNLYNNKTLIWTKNNFNEIEQKIFKWMHGKNKFSICYVKPNGIADGHDGKNVFFMVDDNFANVDNSGCLIL